ncbi:MAG: nucleotide exchange factor GrpE [Planctomycetota bacterium]
MMTHDPNDKPRIILPPGVSYPEPEAAAPSGPGGTPEALPSAANESETILSAMEQALEAEQARAARAEKELLLQRAEFENFRKRLQRTTDDRVRFASQSLVTDLLRVLDDFDRALLAAASSPDQPLREGLRMVRESLWTALQSNGVSSIPSAGQPFDPNLHEAVHVMDRDDVPHDTVIEVATPGYMLQDRVVRAAKVVVSRHSDPTTKISTTPPAAAGDSTTSAGDAPPAGD